MLDFLNKLEDPERPLLGPNIKASKFWGVILPKNIFKRYFYLLSHILLYTFVATEYVDIYFTKGDLTLVLNNLKIALPFLITAFKVFTVFIWKKKWFSIIEYVTRTDVSQRKTDDETSLKILASNTRYCRRVTYIYWTLSYAIVIIVIFMPIIKYFSSPEYRENVRNGTGTYTEVISSWVPFSKRSIPGYLAASVFQTYAAVFGAGCITTFDTNSMVIMVFFKTELQLLHQDSKEIFGTEKNLVSHEESFKRLKDCGRRHNDLVKYAEMFDSCLSPIMLLYMCVCSIMLCVTGYQITTIEIGAMQKLLASQLFIFGVSQLFVYCWHSNEVYYASQDLSMGLYCSTWWMANALNKQYVHILGGQFQKLIVFSVGFYSKLTIPTFITILKGAYSYYTLLSKSQMK